MLKPEGALDLLLLCPRPICLSDVCLSVAYIGRNSRTERPRKTKIGTEVARVTRDSDNSFKVKRSKVKGQRSRSPGRFTQRGLNAKGGCCSGQRGNVFGKYCYVASARRRARRLIGRPRGRREAGHIVSPRAQLVTRGAHCLSKRILI